MSDIDKWYKEYQREETQRLDRAKQRTNYLIGALRFFGVKRVTVEFDGYGDDGEVKEPVYEPTPKGGLPEELAGTLHNAMCDLLPGGFEIESGSLGEIVIDVVAGSCNVNIEWREDEDEEFFDDEDEG